MNTSIWKTNCDDSNYPALAADLRVDTVVIGGGITGITTAQLLAEAGQRVVVVEANTVGSGTTGQSTGNLYALVDTYLHRLIDHWSVEQAQLVVRSRAAAVDLIEQNVARFGIDCDFTRVPWVLYAIGGAAAKRRMVIEEYEAARALGLPARLWGCLPFVFPVDQAVVIPGQAQFNPLRYVRQLAAAIVGDRCAVYEYTPVVDIDPKAGVVRTRRHAVHAQRIVLATHTPKGFNIQQAEVAPYREYTVAGPMAHTAWPRGIYWAVDEPAYSTRSVRIGDQDYLLSIGKKHKVGQQLDTAAAYADLRAHARERFGVQRFDFQWSAQHYRSADGLPFIGRAVTSPRVLIATGFGIDGLVYGTVAASVLSDEIRARASDYAALYSPRRFTPLKSATSFLVENANATAFLIRDRFGNAAKLNSLAAIPPGEGRIIELNGEKLAVYREVCGEASGNPSDPPATALHAVSAVCTHLKGIVHWNSAERTWDCPCHGSRFDIDGQVIEGPALAPLACRTVIETARRETPGVATSSINAA